MKSLVCAFIFALSGAEALAQENVIFITIDGARYQEFFKGVRRPKSAGQKRGTRMLPWLDAKAEKNEAFIYGRHRLKNPMLVSNPVNLSKPAYMSLMSGVYEDKCRSNDCENTTRHTIFDSLAEQGFAKKDIAVFASWPGIEEAAESVVGRATRNIGINRYSEPGADPVEQAWIDDYNARAFAEEAPWGEARRDVFTFEVANHYLKRHAPRFLYISFLDTDEWGHKNNYKNYVQSFQDVNHYLEQLEATLASMGDYGKRTSIVITTDHGRNPGPLWYNHSAMLPTAHRVWAAVIPSETWRAQGVKARKKGKFRHVDIRPTLEGLMQVKSVSPVASHGKSLVTH
ncbi:MAG: hypothetical protein JNL01_11000 [Bdellovibrionales bacterium]|nr:hypothetical protein [Bdellovibrionales bacterium]